VPDPGSPTGGRRRLALGKELRRLRRRAGLTGAQAANALRASVSKISRIETGNTKISQRDLARLLDAYHVSDANRLEILALARESATTPAVDEAKSGAFTPGYDTYIEAEADAITIWNWEPQLVPGLLQTKDYAREVMRGWNMMFQLPPVELDRKVEARMARQQILSREQPPNLVMVIDESVLRRRFGADSVMREQLDRLAASSNLRNTDIRILALNGSHPIGTGSFMYMQFAKVHAVPQPDVVVAEFMSANRYTDDFVETNQYRVAFEQLLIDAMDADQSYDLIVRTAREVWS
jgi:transcriptional regulator with XRE-family HTH domain